MRKIYDDQRNEIGYFDGRFVYCQSGKKIYWIEDGEIFSFSDRNDDYPVVHRPLVKTGNLIDRIAFDPKGKVIFVLD